MSSEQAQININTSVDQSGLNKGLKETDKNLKDFTKGASKQIPGVGKAFNIAALGPAALGAAAVLAGRQVVRALNNMAAESRVLEQAQIGLANAARNNPLLNDNAVRQLERFANEMQRATGIDNAQILQAQTQLASMGRSQQEIQRIVEVAADMSASGMMNFDYAVRNFSMSLDGYAGSLRRVVPELRNMSKEALESGGALDLLAGRVSGAAAEAMRSGAGSVIAYQNAISDLRRIIGARWEEATQPARRWLTDIINRFNATVEARQRIHELFSDELVTEINVAELSAEERARYERMGRDIAHLLGVSLNAVGRSFETLEESLRTLASASGVNVELVRQIVLEYGNIDDQIKGYLIQLGDITRAEREAAIAQDASVRADAAAMEARTVEAMQFAEQARMMAGLASAAASDHNLAIAESARARAKEYARLAEDAALVERERIQREADHAKIRAENLEALNEEIAVIERRAKIEGQSIESAEVQQQMLQARINAFQNLVAEIGDAAEEEQRTLRELQEEFRRLGIQSANELLVTNRRNLEAMERQINEIAALEGRATGDVETQIELQDARARAYSEQMRILRNLIDGTQELTAAEQQALEARWRSYAQMEIAARRTSAANREELQAAIDAQQELARTIDQIYRDATGQAKMNEELQREQELQDALIQLRKISMQDAVEYERRIRRMWAVEEAQRLRHELNAAHEAAMEAQHLTHRQKEEAEEQHAAALKAIRDNLQAELTRIDRQATEEREQVQKKSFQKGMDAFQNMINQMSSIAGSLTSIWTNNIDRQTQNKLRANDAMVQSDEERAANERKIMKEAQLERFKVEMNAWAASVMFAKMQVAVAAITAFAEALKGTGPAGPVIAGLNAALVTAAGIAKVASVISARPNPPRFHSGGEVPGRKGQEVGAVLLAGERVSTETQWANQMQAISNLAHMAYRPQAEPQRPSIKIYNNAADTVTASADYDVEGAVISIVNKGLVNGQLDRGLNQQQSRIRGRGISTW